MHLDAAMTRPLLLLISYHFPPSGAIGGARPYRFTRYLRQRGYDVHVLTATQQPPGAQDVEYVADPRQISSPSGLLWQAERVAWKFFLRGELLFGWAAATARAGVSFLKNHPSGPVAVLSSGPPVGAHLAAGKIALETGCPWIADFRDPIDTLAGESARFQKLVAPGVEHQVLKRSSLVLANTEPMRDRWAKRYPDVIDKIHVLWNGFDPEDPIIPYQLPLRARKILSHVGELYAGRTISPILEAAGRLISTGEISSTGICVRQIGPAEPQELPPQSFIDAATAAGWLEITPPVPSAEARSLAIDSDGLLLIQPQTALQVPGKLFDYLRMGRPILAFVMKNSPVERILENAGVPYVCIFPEDSPPEMDRKLKGYVGKLTREPAGPSQWFLETFDGARQAEALDALIKPVLERG